MNILDLIDYLKKMGYKFHNLDTNEPFLKINGTKIIFNIVNKKYKVEGISVGHERILDLTRPENYSVVMFLIKLLKKGYSKNVISLEKRWQLGHNDSGSLDVMLKNPINNDIYMIEIKSQSEINKYVNLNNEKKLKQVFSYAIQEKTTKIISFYSYDFSENKDMFYNVYTEDILKESQNVDDFFERWNKVFDKSDYISNNKIFNSRQSVKKYSQLENITNNDTKNLFNQFATILRLHSISDKPNAFIKMINLFLAKINDEITSDKKFEVKDNAGNIHTLNGMKFQYIRGIDTPVSFMKRLNELYKEGMKEYLNKDVIDYNDEEIDDLLPDNVENRKLIVETFDNLRLKKNNNFTFIDVFDDETFYLNFEVVKSVVELLENYIFKYDTKHQFLGDFFEELLNTSLKQEAGQFFTPYPIVDFMVDSLPYEKLIKKNVDLGRINFIPSVIDYACGTGHFLISSMAKTQEIIKKMKNENYNFNELQTKKINAYIDDPYSWVNKRNCVGIEKDYRLAKTTKIATFLNGDGNAEIISGDGINKFNSKDYENTILNSSKNKIEKFDFVISNPPYSIDGFMRNFSKNGITPESGDFSLLKKLNYTDSAIETFFVERTEQLLVNNGYCAIVLPQSILSNSKYENMRRFMFKNFEIKALVMTSDITFSGTTTSPVILFLKKTKVPNKHYKTLVVGSPKYMKPTGSKMKDQEIKFLGYEFSTNRAKSGITIKDNSILSKISPIINNFISNDEINIPKNLSNLVYSKYFDDILLNSSKEYCGDIYPKYNLSEGKPLSNYCKINCRTTEDFDKMPSDYLEIGGLSTLQTSEKKKTTNRFCKKGDILVSSLCPKRNQIKIADKDYMVTTAIHVLSDFESEEIKEKIYEKIRSDDVLEQMNSLLDGFKITYAKISDANLINNILINI